MQSDFSRDRSITMMYGIFSAIARLAYEHLDLETADEDSMRRSLRDLMSAVDYREAAAGVFQTDVDGVVVSFQFRLDFADDDE